MMRSPCRECTTNKLPKCIAGCKIIAEFQTRLFDIPSVEHKSIAVSRRYRAQS
jgi:hypothetical protein